MVTEHVWLSNWKALEITADVNSCLCETHLDVHSL